MVLWLCSMRGLGHKFQRSRQVRGQLSAGWKGAGGRLDDVVARNNWNTYVVIFLFPLVEASFIGI